MHVRLTTALLVLALCCLCTWIGATQAATLDETSAWSSNVEKRMKQMEALIGRWSETPPNDKTIVALQNETQQIRDTADACVTQFQGELTTVKQKLEALGDPTQDASAELAAARNGLKTQRQAIDQQLSLCRLIAVSSRDLKDQITVKQREIRSRQLLDRSAPVWTVIGNVMTRGFSEEQINRSRLDVGPAITTALALSVIFVPLSLVLRSRLRAYLPESTDADTAAPSQRMVLIKMYSSRAPWLATLTAVVIALWAGGSIVAAAVCSALLISFSAGPLIQLFFCQGRLRCAEGLPARLLVDLVLITGALIMIQVRDFLVVEAYLLLRAGLFFVFVVIALWLQHRLSHRTDLETLRRLRLPIMVALLAGPIAEWLGYRNLGEALTLGVYGSGSGVLITWLLLSLLGQLFRELDNVDAEPQPDLRMWLGYNQGERIPGIGIMWWLIRIGTLIGLAYWLLFAWQVSQSDTTVVRDLIRDGFTVGAVHIVPAKLVLATIAFLLLLMLARWLRRQLGERWLTRTTLDSGARQSVVSLTSYAIIGVAIMLSLSMAGLNFENLAIVAGALSVGIGFGLQNIVNNFVSGLILLFERPVRPGDWVVVGTTEGYVRKISIRYTLIQTFDRADVLVPNSELISNQVTNLMLTDTFGRVVVPVGVAYGTNTRKVRDILFKVAREHPMTVLEDPRVGPPRVFFMGFGDNSLDFELRLFIENIDYKLSVRSEILFAIDDAFREAEIEIPFPQRVVHVQQENTASVVENTPQARQP